jgi:PEP-CTERM motif
MPKLWQIKAMQFHNILKFGSRIARVVRPLFGVVVRGGAFVKSIRWYLILIVLGLSSSAALADGIDPALGVKGDGDQAPWTGTLSVLMEPGTGITCTGGFCDFTSESFSSIIDITNFDYFFSQSQGTVESNPFTKTADDIFPILTIIKDVNTANPEAILSGGLICGTSDEVCDSVFSFILETDGAVQGTTVTYTSNVPLPVPEPGTLILMVSGLGVLGLHRRMKKTPA